MSAQINLYHERFRKQRDLLTLTNVTVASAVVLLVVLFASMVAAGRSSARQAEAKLALAEFKLVKDEFDSTATALAALTPSPQLISEIQAAEQLWQRRESVAALLESGAIGSTAGFAQYLGGLARQIPEGLWLTGFRIDAGGKEMEIRGRMFSPLALPEYIRRLGTEPIFQGRNFAALTMERPAESLVAKPVAATNAGAATAAPTASNAAPAPSAPPRYIEFVLTPKPGDPRNDRGGRGETQ